MDHIRIFISWPLKRIKRREYAYALEVPEQEIYTLQEGDEGSPARRIRSLP